MKHYFHASSFAVALSFGALTLVGCGGALNLPDSVVSSQASGPPLQVSVYGGHAPVQGSHVYLLQPGTTGYGSLAVSILGSGTTSSPDGYPLASNVNDPNVPATAGFDGKEPQYVTTDSSGAASLTGAYTCTVGQPVYMYAFGGNIGTSAASATTYTVSQIVVSNRTTGTGGTATYAVTISASTALTSGESITVSGLTGNFSILNATQSTSTASSGTTVTFVATDHYTTGGGGNLANGTYTTTTFGTAGTIKVSTPANNNTQNVNSVALATLGNCPASGNFSTGSGALSYIYMNEVSTVATAYTFQPFTLATNNDAWHIGSSGTTQALLGIENAAATAAQLYAIQGNGPQSTATDGEGHLANTLTQSVVTTGGTTVYTPNEGNGIVPQATLDSLANIIAGCVDSVPAAVGTTTAQCSALFSIATDNGATTGTQPTDTGTAAINIARFPAGNSSTGSADATFAKDIFNLQTGTVPYVPDLAAAPNDWTIAISYPQTETLNTNMNNPESIAVDGLGDVVFSNQGSDYIIGFSPLGVPYFNYLNTGSTPGYVTIDPNNNVWFGSITNSKIVEIASSGNSYTTSTASFETVSASATDSSGNFYFVAVAGTNADVYEYTNSFGSTSYSPFTGSVTCIPSKDTYDHLTIDSAQQLWVADEHGSVVCRFTATGSVATGFPVTTGAYPEVIGIDASDSAWVTLEDANDIDHITNTGGLTQLTSTATGATFNYPFSAAIDGAGNIWVTNRSTGNYSTSSIAELNNSGKAISPSTNYQNGPGILYDPLNAAVDPSGNVWITNYNGQKVVELVGAAAPTVTPLSYASGHAGLGAKP